MPPGRQLTDYVPSVRALQDLLFSFISLYNTLMKIFFIGATATIVFWMVCASACVCVCVRRPAAVCPWLYVAHTSKRPW